MRLADLVAPIATAHRDDVQLGIDDSPSDGSGNLLRDLGTQPHVSVVISDSDDGLEPGALAGSGLLLNVGKCISDRICYRVTSHIPERASPSAPPPSGSARERR